jgi:hypothetical protein
LCYAGLEFLALRVDLVGSPRRLTAASRRGKLVGLEAAAAVGAVTKGLILGLSATAQRHGFFPGRNDKLVAQVVNDFDGSQDEERPIFSTANHGGLCHG